MATDSLPCILPFIHYLVSLLMIPFQFFIKGLMLRCLRSKICVLWTHFLFTFISKSHFKQMFRLDYPNII